MNENDQVWLLGKEHMNFDGWNFDGKYRRQCYKSEENLRKLRDRRISLKFLNQRVFRVIINFPSFSSKSFRN